MRKTVMQVKKSLSAILAAAMVLTTAPVAVMADDLDTSDIIMLEEASDYVAMEENIAEVEEEEEVEEEALVFEDFGDEGGRYVGGIHSFNPNGGSFDPKKLVSWEEDNVKHYGAVNAYCKATVSANGLVLDESSKLLNSDGTINGEVDYTAPLYFRYFVKGDAAPDTTVNDWESIAPVKEGYTFVGWYEKGSDGKPDLEKRFPYSKLTAETCVDKEYVAAWVVERILPDIKESDVKLETYDNRIAKATITIDQEVFKCFDPKLEDLYVMRYVGTELPNDTWNNDVPSRDDGWYWHWTRWGNGAWNIPIEPGTEQIELTEELYYSPATDVVNLGFKLQYFTCKKGADGLPSSDLNQPVVKAFSKKQCKVYSKFYPKSAADFSPALSDRFFEYSGKEIKPKVTVRDGSTPLKENVDYAVEYRDNLDAGTGMAIVSGKGSYESIIQKLLFYITQKTVKTKNVKINFSRIENRGVVAVYDGKTLIPAKEYTASVKGKDIYNLTDEDSYEVVITLKENSNYVFEDENGVSTKTKSETFRNVKKKKDFAATHSVEFTDPSISSNVIYTGKAIKPAVTVKVKDAEGNYVIAPKNTYTVKYYKNVEVSHRVGDNLDDWARVEVTGKGEYEGSINKYFFISRKPITPKVDTNIKPANYNGKAYMPKPKVTATALDANGKEKAVSLKLGKDYELTYENNINAGTGTVKVWFSSNFDADMIPVTFEIKPVAITSIKPVGTYYKGASYTGATIPATVKASAATLPRTDYNLEISYPKDANGNSKGTIKVTATAKSGNVTVPEGKTISFEKRLAQEALSSMNDSYKRVVYYGESYSLSGNYLASKADGTKLYGNEGLFDVTGNDVDVTALQIGKTATVTWKVKNTPDAKASRYKGSKSIKVKYAAKNIADSNVGLVDFETVSPIPAQTLEPGGKVEISREKLIELLANSPANEAYSIAKILEVKDAKNTTTISFVNNKKKSTASKPAYVVIKGKGNFTGTIKIPFVIK